MGDADEDVFVASIVATTLDEDYVVADVRRLDVGNHNAHLIAAAPEMLNRIELLSEALRVVLGECCAAGEQKCWNVRHRQGWDALSRNA